MAFSHRFCKAIPLIRIRQFSYRYVSFKLIESVKIKSLPSEPFSAYILLALQHSQKKLCLVNCFAFQWVLLHFIALRDSLIGLSTILSGLTSVTGSEPKVEY